MDSDRMLADLNAPDTLRSSHTMIGPAVDKIDRPLPASPRDLDPVTWRTLLTWARLTIRIDRKYHQAQPRSITARRLLRSLTPNLHRPVFLIGAGRSGSTFLGSCLGALPELSFHHEPAANKRAAPYVYQGLWTDHRAR